MNTVDRLRAGRAAKAVEEAVARELDLQRELDSIDERIERAHENYRKAFKKATAVAQDDPALWRKANEAQTSVINAENRRRMLQRHLAT